MATITITPALVIDEAEIELTAVRSQGPGGQNVNKVASAISLRFDIPRSSLPERYKTGLMALADKRITRAGVVTIKAQRFRTQEANREDAVQRLVDLIVRAGTRQKPRVATKPSKAARAKRVDEKKQRAGVKSLRRKPAEE
ncbi:MAG: aminoacyl-tRNA hydrolase [Proteobacteria bacterium]|nr:aminoacyl-tRNA hydrolase [Pseudomonadota bacterium]